MKEKILLSEYLKEHNKDTTENDLTTGILIAFGIPFDPDIHTDNSGQLTHYFKNGERFEIRPDFEKIPKSDWLMGTIDWSNSSLKIKAENKRHLHLKWWSDIYVETYITSNSLETSKSRKHNHIIMFEKACKTLLEKNGCFPTAKEVWYFLERAIDEHESYYYDAIEDITPDKIIYIAQNNSEKSINFNSFENQISRIRKKHKS